MNEYEKWADEYLKNADDTMEIIRKYREKMRNTKSDKLRLYYDHKILTLYEMYNDCMYAAGELRKKASRLKQRGG